MTFIGRDRILQDPNERRYVAVEAFGGEVRLRSLTARELDLIRQKCDTEDWEATEENYLLLIHCWVDEDGRPVWNEQDVRRGVFEEVDGLEMTKVLRAAMHHSGIQATYHARSIVEKKSDSNGTPQNSIAGA